MLVSGVRAPSTERPAQPISRTARTTNSTGHEYRANHRSGLLNHSDWRMPDNGLHLGPVSQVLRGDTFNKRGIRCFELADEEIPQFARQTPRRLRMLCKCGDEIDPVPHAVGGRSRRDRAVAVAVNREGKGLCRGVMLARVEDELVIRAGIGIASSRGIAQVPASEHSRGGGTSCSV